MKTLLMNLVANPFHALTNANYIGILSWAIVLGFALRNASSATHQLFDDLSHAVSAIVRWIIRLAPLGVFGLVTVTAATTGFGQMIKEYGQLLLVLVGCMFFVAFVMNPLIVFWKIKKNPYPLVLLCLCESGIPAFFTRSSAANIPVNMNLAKRLNLHEDTYSVSIPLGATINMAGAAITIYRVGTCRRAHTRHSSGLFDCVAVELGCNRERVWCFGRGRWFVAADSIGVQLVQYPKRHRHASGGSRLYYWRDSRFLRNRAQFINRCVVYGSRRYGA